MLGYLTEKLRMKKRLQHILLCTFLLVASQLSFGAITVTSSQSLISCNSGNDGSVTVIPAGGFAPYSYVWSNGANTATISNLAAGIFTVTITDNVGTTAAFSYTFISPSPISISKTITPINCGGGNTGAVNVNVSGGTPGYAFAWSDGVNTQNRSNLTAALYYFTVTDSKGCTKVDSANVTQPMGLVINSTVTDASCGAANGSIALNVQYGYPPYSYSWNDGNTSSSRTLLNSGVYNVTVTDSIGCTASVSKTVSQTGGSLIINATATPPSCNGGNNGSITINSVIGSVAPFTFFWNDASTFQNRTSLVAGNYTVTATSSAGCTGSATINVSQPAGMSINLSVIPLTCYASNNGAINTTVSGGNSPYTYVWNGGFFTQNRTMLASGNYSLTVTDFGGCSATTTTFVPEPLQLSIATTASPLACTGGPTGSVTTTVIGGTGPYSYWWGSGYVTPNRINVNAGTYTVTVTDANGCTATASSTIANYVGMIVTATSTNIVCYGANTGSILTSTINGTPGYTYAWSTGATSQNLTSLTTGTYHLTVTDSRSCTVTGSVFVSQPSFPITINATVNDVVCNGNNNGSISITPTNGSAPYSFIWSDGFFTQTRTALTAGNYSVTVTDNKGCTGSSTYTINQPQPIIISTSVTNETCFGGNTGAITLNATGGNAPFTFLWTGNTTNQNKTNVSAGTYNVTATDNHGCSATASATVTQPTAVGALLNVTNVSCSGSNNGSIITSANGGQSPYTYSWGNGILTPNRSNLPAGNYPFTITDNAGCTYSTTVTITQPSAISVSSTNINVACNGGNTGKITLNISGGTTPYSFAWSDGPTTQNRTNLGAGNYSVTITDNAGCTKTYSTSITQSNTLNVSVSAANVSCNSGNNGSITLSVTGGTAPYNYNWGNNITTQNRANLIAGNYSVVVTDNAGCTAGNSVTITQPSALAVSLSNTNASCNGSSNAVITTTISGGTAPYIFNWGNNITSQNRNNIPAGSYSLTVTDSAGCSSGSTAIVTEPSAISITSTVTNVLCNGSNSGSIGLNVAGGTAPYTYNWNDNSQNAGKTNIAAGTYLVTVTDVNACTVLSTIQVTEPTVLSLTTTVSNVTCYGKSTGNVNLLVSGGVAPYNYNWGFNITTQNLMNVPAGNYAVTVTDNNGCTSSKAVTITQPTQLSTNIVSMLNATCNGSNNGSINISASGGTSPYSFLWDNGLQNQNRTGLTAGNYTVVVSDANGCSANSTINISEPSPITVTFSKTDVLCNGGNNGIITATATGGNAGFTYHWNNSNTSTINNLQAGNYTVTVHDASGCSTTSTVAVIEPSVLQINETHSNAGCNGGAGGSISLVVSGGTGSYNYHWSNGSTAQNISGLTANTYGVTVSDANSCTSTKNTTISQSSTIFITATHTDFACVDHPGTINTVVSGGASPYNYHWSNGATTSTLTNLSAGNYNVTVSDAQSCSSTSSVVVAVVPQLSVSLTKTDAACYGMPNGAIVLNMTGGTTPYNFSWSNGSTSSNISGISAGNYTVNVTDANGCSVSNSSVVGQPAEILLTKNISNAGCYHGNNGSVNILVSGGNAPYNFQWSNTATTQNIQNLLAGNYALTVTDSHNCSTTSGNMIVTEPAALQANTSILPVGCSGVNDGEIHVTTQGGTPPYSYKWGNNSITSSITNLGIGNYAFTVTDNNGCRFSDTLNVGSTPPISITADVWNTSCTESKNGIIAVHITGGSPSYNFNWSNGANSQNINYLEEGNYRLTVTDSRNCTAQSNFNVATDYTLQAHASASATSINAGDKIQITASTNVDHNNSYLWTPAKDIVCNTCMTTDALPLQTTLFTIVVTDANGCKATDTVSVEVKEMVDNIFIPNAFTPNGDGNNDVLELYGNTSSLAFMEFVVFNRWGEKVFETNEHHFQWDGNYRGEQAPQGAYVYTMKYVLLNGTRNEHKGSITILR
jgi:gliding motility-associated-like protein